MSAIQDIFLEFYPNYLKAYTPSKEQAKVAMQIMNCKTHSLGAHVSRCEECGHSKVFYNSCRNRHCPTCQGINNAIWVDKRSEDVLNAPYFHVVFTIPQELHSVVYQNQKLLYTLMYKCVAKTLAELSSDSKYLGAQPGFFSILHTWGQNLHFHPHIHVVVLAGGLTKLNEWQCSSDKFFIPVKVLAKKFRGKFMYYLKRYYQEGFLKFYGNAEPNSDPKNFQRLIDSCYAKDWYTYTKKTFSNPLAVLKYLGRYTHRVAISNSRILSFDDTSVTITVNDYKDQGKTKRLTLSGVEFIRRFLLHVLPCGFVKIRYYGLLANRNKKTKLELCRRLTGSPIYKSKFKGLNKIEILCMLVGKDLTTCPVCKASKLKSGSFCATGAFP